MEHESVFQCQQQPKTAHSTFRTGIFLLYSRVAEKAEDAVEIAEDVKSPKRMMIRCVSK